MAGSGRFKTCQLVELFVLTGHHCIPDFVLHLHIPLPGDKGDQSVHVPFGDCKQSVVLDLGTDTRTIDHAVEDHLGDTGPDLLFEMLIIAVEKEQYLPSDNFCHPSGIVIIPFSILPDIALFQIRQGVE